MFKIKVIKKLSLFFLSLAVISGCTQLRELSNSGTSKLSLVSERYGSKTISVAESQQTVHNFNLARVTEGILKEAGMTVFTETRLVDYSEKQVSEQTANSDQKVVQQSGLKVQYQKTDFIIDTFIPTGMGQKCSLRLIDQAADRVIKATTFFCHVNGLYKASIVQALGDLGVLRSALKSDDKSVSLYDLYVSPPASREAQLKLSEEFIQTRFVVLPYNTDPFFLESALKIEQALIDLGAYVEHLPAESNKTVVTESNAQGNSNNGLSTKYASMSASYFSKTTEAPYIIRVVPSVSYGNAVSYTVTLYEANTQKLLSAKQFSSGTTGTTALWNVLIDSGFARK